MELAGIVVSGVGLLALGSTVEDIFNKITTWRHQGEDYKHLSLQIELAQLAYQRWQKTVKLVEPNAASTPDNLPYASPQEVETVRKLLSAIRFAFRDVERTSRRYETDGDEDEINEKTSPRKILNARARAATRARRMGSGMVNKVKWVVHDKKALQTLTERVSGNVSQLVELFPDTVRIQKALAILDLASMVPADDENERQHLFQVLSAAAKVDPILQASAGESIDMVDQRHRYLNIRATENGHIMNGDQIAAGSAVPTGPGHFYEDISASGHSLILNGDSVGMKSIFDD